MLYKTWASFWVLMGGEGVHNISLMYIRGSKINEPDHQDRGGLLGKREMAF